MSISPILQKCTLITKGLVQEERILWTDVGLCFLFCSVSWNGQWKTRNCISCSTNCNIMYMQTLWAPPLSFICNCACSAENRFLRQSSILISATPPGFLQAQTRTGGANQVSWLPRQCKLPSFGCKLVYGIIFGWNLGWKGSRPLPRRVWSPEI